MPKKLGATTLAHRQNSSKSYEGAVCLAVSDLVSDVWGPFGGYESLSPLGQWRMRNTHCRIYHFWRSCYVPYTVVDALCMSLVTLKEHFCKVDRTSMALILHMRKLRLGRGRIPCPESHTWLTYDRATVLHIQDYLEKPELSSFSELATQIPGGGR